MKPEIKATAGPKLSFLTTLVSRLRGFIDNRLTAAKGFESFYMIMPTWSTGGHRTYHPGSGYLDLALGGYARNELVYACIREVATSVAEAPLVSDNPRIHELLQSPTPLMSGAEWVEALVSYRLIDGNVFIKLGLSPRGELEALWLLRPDLVTWERNRWVYRPPPDADGRPGDPEPLTPENHVHLKMFNPLDDWCGLSPLGVLTLSADNDNHVTEFVNQLLHNAGVPPGLITTAYHTDQAERERIRDDWREKFSGKNALSDVAVFDMDASYQQLGLDTSSMDLTSLSNRAESRICAAFGVPPIIVGAYVGLQFSTYANYATARQSLYDETIFPTQRSISADLTHGLRGHLDGGSIYFDIAKMAINQEPKEQVEARTWRAYELGLIGDDEARQRLGLEDEAGDMLKMQPHVHKADGDEEDDEEEDDEQRREWPPPSDPADVQAQYKEIAMRQMATRLMISYWPELLIVVRAGVAQAATGDEPEKRLQVISAKTDEILVEQQPELARVLINELEDAAEMAAELEMTRLSRAISFGFDEDGVNIRAALWAERHGARLAKRMTETTQARVRVAVGRWIRESEDLPALAARLEPVLVNRSRAEMVAVTEVTRAYAEANALVWRESGVIERIRWHTANDEIVRACPVCWPLHKRTAPLDVGFAGYKWPPAHPRCRCWITPVLPTGAAQRYEEVNL